VRDNKPMSGRGDQAICGAKTRSGGSCHGVAMENGRCRLHGGHSLGKGKPDGRPVTRGIHSKRLPKGLMETYEDTLKNPDPFNLIEKIALQNAFINMHLEQIGKCPPTDILETMSRMIRQHRELLMETVEEVPVELDESLQDMDEWVNGVVASKSSEKEIRQLIVEQAQLVKAEAMRIEKSARYLTIEGVMALIAALADIVNREVEDAKARFRIAEAIARLSYRRASEEIESGVPGSPEPQGLPQSS